MCKFSQDMKARLGNAIIFITERVKDPTKTKVLKLLYIMEEEMAKTHGVPFLSLPYEVWKMGPVQKDTFIDISSGCWLLSDYITATMTKDASVVKAKGAFNPDEFSDAELEMMNEVISTYGSWTARQLVRYLHRGGSLWANEVERHGFSREFADGTRNNSDVELDLSQLLPEDRRDGYIDSLTIHRTANELNAHANV